MAKKFSGIGSSYFFINVIVFLFASISQSVYQCLPGRNPYFFYTCNGVIPPKNEPIKFNYFLSCSFVLTFVVYVAVLVKIKIYEYKDPIPTLSLAVSQNETTVTNKFYSAIYSLNASLANLTTLALSLSLALPFVGLLNVLNQADPGTLGQFPFYQLAFVYEHIMPAVLHGAILIFYFNGQPHMRKTLCSKVRDMIQKFYHWQVGRFKKMAIVSQFKILNFCLMSNNLFNFTRNLRFRKDVFYLLKC